MGQGPHTPDVGSHIHSAFSPRIFKCRTLMWSCCSQQVACICHRIMLQPCCNRLLPTAPRCPLAPCHAHAQAQPPPKAPLQPPHHGSYAVPPLQQLQQVPAATQVVDFAAASANPRMWG